MSKPHKKKMGRPLEGIPLRKLVHSIRQDIDKKLSNLGPTESSKARKPKRKQG